MIIIICGHENLTARKVYVSPLMAVQVLGIVSFREKRLNSIFGRARVWLTDDGTDEDYWSFREGDTVIVKLGID
jgi:hypothetical protein